MPKGKKRVFDDVRNRITSSPSKRSRLDCCVCHDVALEPFQTRPCGHVICKECYTKLKKRHRNQRDGTNMRCPLCKTILPLKSAATLDKKLQREALQLLAKCCNYEKGCSKELAIGDLKKHEDDECNWTEIRCEKCNKSTPRHQLKEHKKSYCPKRQLKCPYCKKKMEFRALEKHQKDCPKRLVKCSRCDQNISADEMKQHNKEGEEGTCPKAIVRCPVSACRHKYSKDTLEEHCLEVGQAHLKYTQQYKVQEENQAALEIFKCQEDASVVFPLTQWLDATQGESLEKCWESSPFEYRETCKMMLTATFKRSKMGFTSEDEAATLVKHKQCLEIAIRRLDPTGNSESVEFQYCVWLLSRKTSEEKGTVYLGENGSQILVHYEHEVEGSPEQSEIGPECFCKEARPLQNEFPAVVDGILVMLRCPN
eukprot:m.29000 g.29000  ORF g.29000 m.29000 type:complete len:425 (+) comp31120_c0_seq2:138-1412(+)